MDAEEKPPEPEGPGETADARKDAADGDTITSRALHEWQTAYQAAQPLAVWLRLVRNHDSGLP